MIEFKRTKVRATTIALTCLAGVFVILRFVTRYMTVRTKNLATDDWLIVVAIILTICSMVANLLMIDAGLGMDMSDINPEEMVRLFKIVLIDEYIYLFNLTIIKLSILLMYKRLFPIRTVRRAAQVLGGISITWALVYTIVASLQCIPLKKLWQPEIEGTCISLFELYMGNAIPNVLTDMAILVLPLTQVWRLQVRLWQRIVLIGMFLLGSFVVFISIYRLVLLLQINSTNTSRTLEPALTWSHVEMCTAVISACLPTLPPVFASFCHSIGLSKVVSSMGDRSRGISLPDRLEHKTTGTAPPSSRASINRDEM
ncbi:hypothetical protein E8E11_010277 [Didymella keratinophila]|nr:hypothetical protein E8E11_010277 [Didymella keratinophila]